MSRYVIDASVGAKWFFDEEYSDAARRLKKGDPQLLVPDLFYIEIGNVYAKKVRRGELNADVSAILLGELFAIDLKIHPALPLIDSAFDLALKCRSALYDVLYLELAMREKCSLVTADRRFVETVSSIDEYPIIWVDDLP